MTDSTVEIDLQVANEDEFRETLSKIEDHAHRVREELQALNDEMERTGELTDEIAPGMDTESIEQALFREVDRQF